MKINSRQQKLLNLLVEQIGVKTITEYAHHLGVSNRTIHGDIKRIEPILNDRGLELKKTPGVGIQVVKSKTGGSTKHAIKTPVGLQLTPKERQFQIMTDLLFNEETLTYVSLSEKYYISLSSLQNDFKNIRSTYLGKNTARIVSDSNGTRLEGTEENIRQSMIRYNEVCLDGFRHIDDYAGFINFLKKRYGEEIVTACIDIINDFENYNLKIIANHYRDSLLSVMIVIVYRASLFKYSTDSSKNLVVNEVTHMFYSMLSRDILGRIDMTLNIEFADTDYELFSKYLRANRVQYKESAQLQGKDIEDNVDRIILELSKNLNVDLSDDEFLRSQLLAHMQSMIFRLRNGITIKNPLLEEIKDEYRVLFGVLWMVLNDVFDSTKLVLTEDEVGFILIHIQTALDKKEKSKKVLVVCPNGISTSQLIVNRIRNLLPPLDIMETSSVDMAMSSDLTQIDFVVSTVPLDIEGKPVVTISPLLTAGDVSRISRLYSQKLIENEENESQLDGFNTLPKYLSVETIELRSDFSNRNQVIEYMCDHLYKLNYVEKEYKNAVFNREKLGTTCLNSGAAIPHGDVKFVKKTHVALFISKKGFRWNESNVKVAAFPCIKQDEIHLAKEIFQDIYGLLKEKENIESLSICKDSESVIKLIEGGIHDKKRNDSNR